MPSPKFDIFSMLMLLGIVQGFFLAYFFLSKRPRLDTNIFLGLILLSFSLVTTEVFLCYSNLMFDALFLVDFSEPCNFLLSPLCYLYIRAKLSKPFSWRKQWWHFAPFFVYTLYMAIVFFPQGDAYKLNAYLGAYHPEIAKTDIGPYLTVTWLYVLRDWVNELTLMHLLVYMSLTFFSIFQAFKEADLPFFSTQNPELAWCRNWAIQMLSIIVLFILVKLNFKHDLGDHILAAHITLIIYMVSFKVVRSSVFLHPAEEGQAAEEKRKYEKSTVTEEAQAATLVRLRALMEAEKPFLQPDFSLPLLAKMLKVTPHQLSQMLNDGLQMTFFELTAQYRIEEAKKLLLSHPNHKIEEIAEMVGYLSKSAFNTGFKKLVGLTPSEYKKNTNS